MLRYQRYWTLERLRGLVQVLQSLGFYEDDAWFLGPDVAQWPIHSALLQGDFSHPLSQTADGLSLLVEVHVLSPGRSGLKNRTYRRPFFPEKMEDVTVERLAQIYQERNQRRTRRKREPVDQPGFELAIGLVPGMEFWTPERLAWLVEVMKSFAHHDDAGGWCFGAEPLQVRLFQAVSAYGFSEAHLATPLSMLVFLGVLAPGKAGPKARGYTRPFFPHVPITQEGVDAYCVAARERFGRHNDQRRRR